MELSSPADEGEPGNNVSGMRNLLFLFFLSAVVFSCTPGQKKAPPSPPVDSAAIKQRQQQVADSLAKAKAPKKKIYLTFDDGPNKGTLKVLQAVQQEQVPVSFFLVGKHVFDSPAQHAAWLQLKADSSNELCNHSYTHALNRYSKFYSDAAGAVADFEKSRDQLQFHNSVARMPGRNAWRIDTIDITDIRESKAAIDSVHKAGFAIMGWDIEWSFDHQTLAPDPDRELLLRRIRNLLDAGTTKTPGHLVLLAHDQAFQKEEHIAQLHSFIQELKINADYEFVVASKYPGVEK